MSPHSVYIVARGPFPWQIRHILGSTPATSQNERCFKFSRRWLISGKFEEPGYLKLKIWTPYYSRWGFFFFLTCKPQETQLTLHLVPTPRTDEAVCVLSLFCFVFFTWCGISLSFPMILNCGLERSLEYVTWAIPSAGVTWPIHCVGEFRNTFITHCTRTILSEFQLYVSSLSASSTSYFCSWISSLLWTQNPEP